jgi:hypothetical protein
MVVTLVVVIPEPPPPAAPRVVVLAFPAGVAATRDATVITVVVGVGVDTVTPLVVVEAVASLAVELSGAVWADAPGPASISASTAKKTLPG